MSKPQHKFYGAVTLGERGQIVIPQEARDEIGLEPGEKLLVFRQGPGGFGLSIIRAQDVSAFVSEAIRKLSMLNAAVSAQGESPKDEATDQHLKGEFEDGEEHSGSSD